MDVLCSQPYKEALQERLAALPAEPVAKGQRNRGYQPAKVVPPAPVYQVVSLNCHDGSIVGSSLSGSELFRIDQRIEQRLTAGQLLQLLAEALGQELPNLTLLREGQALANTARITLEDVNSLTLREALSSDVTVLLCRKRRDAHRVEARLGEGTVLINYERLPEDGAIQAIQEERHYVTGSESCWMVYSSKEVISFRAGRSEVLEPIGHFPAAPCWRLPPNTRRWGSNCDVWSTQLQLPVRALLDAHAARTCDRPIPRYQMIVDPNQFVDETDAGPVWVPCEFDISSTQRVTLIGADRSHVEPQLAEEVAKPILQSALPLLAKLRRPQLLLEDRRLQVVFKAQRILVPGAVAGGADAEYVGLWHVDGHREQVAAVILYYYHVGDSLHGGDMEFCGREPMDVLGLGDCSNNYRQFHRESLKAALKDGPNGTKVANCRVPIGEGTLLVFSNYQMAHRVLRMCNSSAQEASRDFVALFVLDPTAPLKPARSVLSKGYPTARALRLRGLRPPTIQLIQEFLGHRPSLRLRRLRRRQMLKEQLQPSGEVCGGANVTSTGNGCYSMIGWLHKMLDTNDLEIFDGCGWDGKRLIHGLNLPPSQDRGMSEVLSMETAELDWRLEWEKVRDPELQDLLDASD